MTPATVYARTKGRHRMDVNDKIAGEPIPSAGGNMSTASIWPGTRRFLCRKYRQYNPTPRLHHRPGATGSTTRIHRQRRKPSSWHTFLWRRTATDRLKEGHDAIQRHRRLLVSGENRLAQRASDAPQETESRLLQAWARQKSGAKTTDGGARHDHETRITTLGKIKIPPTPGGKISACS